MRLRSGCGLGNCLVAGWVRVGGSFKETSHVAGLGSWSIRVRVRVRVRVRFRVRVRVMVMVRVRVRFRVRARVPGRFLHSLAP